MSLVLLRLVQRDYEVKTILIDLSDGIARDTVLCFGHTVGDIVGKILSEPQIFRFLEQPSQTEDEVRCLINGASNMVGPVWLSSGGYNNLPKGYVAKPYATIPFEEGNISHETLSLITEASKKGRFRVRTILLSPVSDYRELQIPPVTGTQTVTMEILHKDSPDPVPFCFDITNNQDRTLFLQTSGRVIYKKDYLKFIGRLDHIPLVRRCCLILAKRYNKYRPKCRKLRGASLTRYAERLADEITENRLKNIPPQDWFYGGPVDNMRNVVITKSKVHIVCIF